MNFCKHKWYLFLLATTIATGLLTRTYASGPESLLLVVNSKSKESVTIANHYAMLRNIPDRNVVLLDSISTRNGISVDEFKTTILQPILSEIKERNLTKQIDLIVYSAGFPTSIRLPDDELAKVIPKENLKYFKSKASLNAATYFAQHVLANKFSFVSLNANFYYRKNAAEVTGFNPFGGENRSTFADLQAAYKRKSYDEAIELADKIIRHDAPRPLVKFWKAKCLARLGQNNDCVHMLDQAVSDGWHFAKWTKSLEEFAPLKNNKEFAKVIARMTEVDRTSVSSFSNSTIWRPDGFRTSIPSEGQRYYLSMMLGVTSPKGNTVKEIVSMLKKGPTVDNSNPKGTFYFVSNNSIRARTRAKLIPEVVQHLERLGHSTETIKANLPEKKSDVLGLTMGIAKFDFAKSGSTILPGAICENLTSAGGVMWGKAGTGQTTVGELIRHGAAGASGTVIEPYAIAQKFPHPMIQYYYARGCNLAEAFYQSVHGPYQLLIVGDPLSRPFGKEVPFKVVGIDDSGPLFGKLNVSIQPGSKTQIKSYDLYFDDVLIRSADPGQPIAFDSSKVKDGFHEFRIVAKTDGPVVFSKTKVFAVFIQNRGKLPRVETKSKVLQWGDSLEIELSEPIDAKLIVRKFGEDLKSSPEGNRASSSKRVKGITVPCSELGSGPSRVRIFAQKNSVELCLGTVTVDVKGNKE